MCDCLSLPSMLSMLTTLAELRPASPWFDRFAGEAIIMTVDVWMRLLGLAGNAGNSVSNTLKQHLRTQQLAIARGTV